MLPGPPEVDVEQQAPGQINRWSSKAKYPASATCLLCCCESLPCNCRKHRAQKVGGLAAQFWLDMQSSWASQALQKGECALGPMLVPAKTGYSEFWVLYISPAPSLIASWSCEREPPASLALSVRVKRSQHAGACLPAGSGVCPGGCRRCSPSS